MRWRTASSGCSRVWLMLALWLESPCPATDAGCDVLPVGQAASLSVFAPGGTSQAACPTTRPPMTQPWYRDGLRFRCTRCGHCCTGEPGFVWVSEEDLAAIAEYRKESVEEVRALYTRKARRGLSLREKLNGDCVFWDHEQGCTV